MLGKTISSAMDMNKNRSEPWYLLLIAIVAVVITAGCRQSTDPSSDVSAVAKEDAADEAPETFTPASYEVTGEQLLAARLSPEEAAEGWIRLFDGHTLFGWEITGAANWRIEDGSIVVDRGRQCLLCTSTQWQDYELTLEFNADEETNSGVFLRTPLEPVSPEFDCYEINIAPDDNPYPTASVVHRQRVDADKAPPQTFQTWRRMTMRVEGQNVQVTIDGTLACEYNDPVVLAAGRIGLQHNSGRVAFRDIRLRPLGLQSMLDEELSQWKQYPEMPGSFTVNDEGALHVQGGRTQLESLAPYDDFVLLGEYKMESPEMNSGIFFRCIPGEEMMGYECQISDERKDGSPLSPADCGTGGIFRRQDARVVAGETGKWVTVLLTARGASIAAWVQGIQVSDWIDTRPLDENPRRGLRLEAGTIMIQGHDPGTDVLFRQLAIVPIEKPTASATNNQ